MRPFVLGFIIALALVALAGFGAVETGAVPARQDTPPGPMEKWMARTSLAATINREAPQPPYPFGPPTEADFVAGANLYVQNCAVCHGTPGSSPSAIARGLSVNAPQFAKHGVDDDPEGVSYWKVDHGIRMTAMPAYDKTLDQKSIWQLTYFLKHMPALPPKADAIWKNPRLAAPATPIPIPSSLPGAKQQGTTP
ncbi:MAG TPA: cytochrome c [Candidatus Elarobacter sp.]